MLNNVFINFQQLSSINPWIHNLRPITELPPISLKAGVAGAVEGLVCIDAGRVVVAVVALEATLVHVRANIVGPVRGIGKGRVAAISHVLGAVGPRVRATEVPSHTPALKITFASICNLKICTQAYIPCFVINFA